MVERMVKKMELLEMEYGEAVSNRCKWEGIGMMQSCNYLFPKKLICISFFIL